MVHTGISGKKDTSREEGVGMGKVLAGVVVLLGALSVAQAQSGPGTDASYAALRTLGLGNEAVSVTNLELNRDAGKFLLKSGTVCFAAAVTESNWSSVYRRRHVRPGATDGTGAQESAIPDQGKMGSTEIRALVLAISPIRRMKS